MEAQLKQKSPMARALVELLTRKVETLKQIVSRAGKPAQVHCCFNGVCRTFPNAYAGRLLRRLASGLTTTPGIRRLVRFGGHR